MKVGSCTSTCRNVCVVKMDDEKLLRFDRVVVGLNAYVAALPAKVQASCDVLVKLSCHVPGEPCPRRYYAIVGKLVKQPVYSIWVRCDWDRLENDHRDTDVEQTFPYIVRISGAPTRISQRLLAVGLWTSDELAFIMSRQFGTWECTRLTYRIVRERTLLRMRVTGADGHPFVFDGSTCKTRISNPTTKRAKDARAAVDGLDAEMRSLRALAHPPPATGIGACSQGGARRRLALLNGDADGEAVSGAAEAVRSSRIAMGDPAGDPDLLDHSEEFVDSLDPEALDALALEAEEAYLFGSGDEADGVCPDDSVISPDDLDGLCNLEELDGDCALGGPGALQLRFVCVTRVVSSKADATAADPRRNV